MLRISSSPLPFTDDDFTRAWPKPEPGQTFADVVAAVPRMLATFAAIGDARVDEFADQIPHWIDEQTALRAAALLRELLAQYPTASPIELLWTLAADATEPAKE